jgi:hypothetical protein
MTAVAGSIGRLPPEQRIPAIASLFGQRAALAPAHQGPLLTALANSFGADGTPVNGEWFAGQNEIFHARTHLPQEQKGLLLAALARIIPFIPDGAQFWRPLASSGLSDESRVALPPRQPGRTAYWHNIYGAVTELAPEHREPALTALAGSIGQLPPAQRHEAELLCSDGRS